MLHADAPRLLTVSNRLPIVARWRSGRLQLSQATGGLSTGLERIHQRERGVWIGWPGLESARATTDQYEELLGRLRDKALVPIRLTPDEVDGFYHGFSNGVIWPLFHYLVDRMPLDSGDWQSYCRVNERFAAAVAERWHTGDRVWIHDYQLMLVPGLVRQTLPDARIGFFLHIPFPALDVFRMLPWRREVLEGLLGADVIGFHTHSYAQHFLAAVRQLRGVATTGDHVWWRGRAVHVGVFPMGIDHDHLAAMAEDPEVRARADQIRKEANGRRILLGVDRLDYTKGIPRRLIAFQRLLERQPALRGTLRFVQVAVPSRIDVRAYRAFRRELDELIGRVNGAFGTIDDVPIHYLYRSISTRELAALYRAADVMLVTPLRDGMNLVAKEFIATRTDEDGVLVLSEFAGAADELREALLVNPYDTDGVADTMAQALALDPEDRRHRMRALRERVLAMSVHDWAQTFVERINAGVPQLQPIPARAAAAPDAPAVSGLRAQLAAGRRLILLLDYDGTLVPITATPELARPDPGLLNLLAAVAAHPQIDLHIVTGRSLDMTNRWFWHLPAGLWAEHGAAARPEAGASWERFTEDAGEWIGRVEAALHDATASAPGALVERKSTGLAWHYRMVDPALAARVLPGLRQRLETLLDDAPVDLLDGRQVLELRPRGISKGFVVRRIMSHASGSGQLVAIGDDQTDEEMFAALPPSGCSIHVGGGATGAIYRLADPRAVRAFLARLVEVRGVRRFAAR